MIYGSPLLPTPPPITSILSNDFNQDDHSDTQINNDQKNSSSLNENDADHNNLLGVCATKSRLDGREACQLRHASVILNYSECKESSCKYIQGSSEVVVILSTCNNNNIKSFSNNNYFSLTSLSPFPELSNYPLNDSRSSFISCKNQRQNHENILFGNNNSASIEISIKQKHLTNKKEYCDQHLHDVLFSCLNSCLDLQRYKRITFFVSIYILNDDGSIASAAINATIMTFLSAGVCFKFLPLSITVGILDTDTERIHQNYFSNLPCLTDYSNTNSKKSDFQIILDPTKQEIDFLCKSAFLVIVDTNSGGLLRFNDIKAKSFFSGANFKKVLALCRKAVFSLENLLRSTFFDHARNLRILFTENNYSLD